MLEVKNIANVEVIDLEEQPDIREAPSNILEEINGTSQKKLSK
jgi:hypothetical protein